MLDNSELKVRVEEAAVALLELNQAPAEWFAAEYKAALRLKFNLED
jgi:hypothetical protein